MNVALIIFNRPDLTERVLAEIAKARPAKLLVIADGPRRDHPEDHAKCAAARAVIERFDWPCAVLRHYSDINLGCGLRPATGITWVFEQVDRAIILEDDCVPNQSFFRFCDELLERYADDERVVQIAGNAHQFGPPRGDRSYFFSRYNVCAGGFATWRRAWRHFDLNAADWASLRDTGWLRYATGDARAEQHLRLLFDAALAGRGHVDFWDFQWIFACLLQNGLTIVPRAGLLSNLGFRPDGTHTRGPNQWANLPMSEMSFPLNHPPHVALSAEADAYFVEHVMPARRAQPPVQARIRRQLHAGFAAARSAVAAMISGVELLF